MPHSSWGMPGIAEISDECVENACPQKRDAVRINLRIPMPKTVEAVLLGLALLRVCITASAGGWCLAVSTARSPTNLGTIANRPPQAGSYVSIQGSW